MTTSKPVRARASGPIVAVDFDGTIVEHCYPDIGPEVSGAVDTLIWLNKIGARLILYTMRDGDALTQAHDYLKARGVELWAVNENPEQGEWTMSHKVYAHVYIDDAALGCPLDYPLRGRPHVDWSAVRAWLENKFVPKSI